MHPQQGATERADGNPPLRVMTRLGADWGALGLPVRFQDLGLGETYREISLGDDGRLTAHALTGVVAFAREHGLSVRVPTSHSYLMQAMVALGFRLDSARTTFLWERELHPEE